MNVESQTLKNGCEDVQLVSDNDGSMDNSKTHSPGPGGVEYEMKRQAPDHFEENYCAYIHFCVAARYMRSYWNIVTGVHSDGLMFGHQLEMFRVGVGTSTLWCVRAPLADEGSDRRRHVR